MKKTFVLISVLVSLLISCGSSGSRNTDAQAEPAVEIIYRNPFIDSSLHAAIEKGFFPGAQVVIGNRDSLLFSKTYGYHDYSRMDTVKKNDVYDMASCSKVLGSTVAAMRLVGEGRLSLQDQVGKLLPEFAGTAISDLTLFELLTHTTGMRPFIPFYTQLVETTDGQPLMRADSSENYPLAFGDMYINRNTRYVEKYISLEPKEGYGQIADGLYVSPEFYSEMDRQTIGARTGTRGKYVYSDLNLILAQRMMEKVSGESLDRYLAGIYGEMGLQHIGYKPLEWTTLDHIIPTETDHLFRKRTVHGYAHDEVAAILGNVAGHAGLFSNAEDAGALCKMLLNHGQWEGKQILKAEVIREFTSMPLKDKGVYRGIGFDKRKPGNGYYSETSSGHTGYTGTFFWLDEDAGIYLVFLTNRVHPTRNNSLMGSDNLRGKLWKYAVEHFTGTQPAENQE